jgi:hypothetical protein
MPVLRCRKFFSIIVPESFFGILKDATSRLADMSTLLDWDLESQVFPAVRWLVLHRRAKVVDLVHSGLKTVFYVVPKFEEP